MVRETERKPQRVTAVCCCKAAPQTCTSSAAHLITLTPSTSEQGRRDICFSCTLLKTFAFGANIVTSFTFYQKNSIWTWTYEASWTWIQPDVFQRSTQRGNISVISEDFVSNPSSSPSKCPSLLLTVVNPLMALKWLVKVFHLILVIFTFA